MSLLGSVINHGRLFSRLSRLRFPMYTSHHFIFAEQNALGTATPLQCNLSYSTVAS